MSEKTAKSARHYCTSCDALLRRDMNGVTFCPRCRLRMTKALTFMTIGLIAVVLLVLAGAWWVAARTSAEDGRQRGAPPSHRESRSVRE